MWIDLPGTANLRDVGGVPARDGRTVARGRLYRAANLQQLLPESVARLTGELGVTDVVDLRTDTERARSGPGPADGRVRVHRHDLLPPVPEHLADSPLMPWQHGPEEADLADTYLAYLRDRPDSVVGALRAIAAADGAALVHCAAGKDRTGTVVGLALLCVGVSRADVVADYAATNERLDELTALLLQDPVYAVNPRTGQPVQAWPTPAPVFEKFLAGIDERYGGPLLWLAAQGWTGADTARLEGSLLG